MVEDFIGVFDNAVRPEFCTAAIEHFQRMEKLNKTFTRQQAEDVDKLFKDTRSYSLMDDFDASVMHTNSAIGQVFADAIEQGCNVMASKYGILTAMATYKVSETIKIQKTCPAEGYHVWHCEHCSNAYGRRVMQALLYLNDVEEGGETEFLYYSKRFKPVAGRMIIFPAGFTHTHRGNPPLTGDKYIMSTWLEFVS